MKWEFPVFIHFIIFYGGARSAPGSEGYPIYIVPPLAGERWYAVPKGDRTCGPEEKVSPMEPLHGRVHRVQKVLPASSGRVQRVWYRPWGDEFYMLWRSCIGPPSQPKLALSLPIKEPPFCRLTVCGGRAAKGSENHKTSLRLMEMHPYLRLRRYFPRRGKSALCSASVLLSISRHSSARISPFGGDAAAGGRRGAFLERSEVVRFSPPEGRSACFSTGISPVVWFP